MPQTKKYYWLKLKDDFFTQKEIKRLRRLAGGDTYTIIYLKLLLLSLKNEGKIYFDDVGDNFADELSLEIDEEPDNIKMTLNYLQQKGLLELINQDEIYLNEVKTMLGSESESAERVRNYRRRLKQETLQCNVKELPSNNEVTKGNTEIDIELELKKEIDINIENIFNHWNDCKIVVHRKITKDIEKAYKKVIKDYTEDEINIAIKNYSKILKDDKYFFKYKWSLDEFLNRGLTKFLDWKICSNNFIKNTNMKGKDSFNDFEQREYDYDSLEKQLLGISEPEETEFNGEDLLKELRSAKGLN